MFARFARPAAFALALAGCVFAHAATVRVPPTNLTLVMGTIKTGGLSSLAADDSNPLVMTKAMIPNLTVDPVNVQVEATLSAAPTALLFQCLTYRANPGKYALSLQLFNWRTNAFDARTDFTVLLPGNKVQVGTTAVSSATDLYRTSDLRVRAQLKVRALGFSPVFQWGTAFEQAWFLATVP